jgi:hypothetical protein
MGNNGLKNNVFEIREWKSFRVVVSRRVAGIC